MNKISRQNFYMGQQVSPEDLNGLLGYAEVLQEKSSSDLLGLGIIKGFSVEIVDGFIASVSSGLAYNRKGQRLLLDTSLQVDLSSYVPATGIKKVSLGLVAAEEGRNPVLDEGGNSVFTHYDKGVNLVHGDTLPEEVLILSEVEISYSGISQVINKASKIDLPSEISEHVSELKIELEQTKSRTQGYEWKDNTAKIVHPDGFEFDVVKGALRKQNFDVTKSEGYAKGDIIWLEPESYESQTTPPVSGEGAEVYPYTRVNFMGKSITYSSVTGYKEYAVRLRSMVDNNTINPTDEGAIGTAWAIDDPNALLEEGSNANGSYTLYSGGKTIQYKKFVNIGGGAWTYPIVFKDIPHIIGSCRTANSSGGTAGGNIFNIEVLSNTSCNLTIRRVTDGAAQISRLVTIIAKS